jgi:hypothetical protein
MSGRPLGLLVRGTVLGLLVVGGIALILALGGIRLGPIGEIRFGTGVSDGGALEGERRRFSVGDTLAFYAELSEAAGAPSLTVLIAQRGDNGTEGSPVELLLVISDPDFTEVWGELGSVTEGEVGSTFVMRIYRDDDELAEGDYTVVD